MAKRELIHVRANKAEREALCKIAEVERCSSLSETVRVLIRDRTKDLDIWLVIAEQAMSEAAA
ncbi:MAG: hypothetical protein ACYTEQ_22265 [Planctomycetota bacterium]|jgi:hypothetical protein